VKAMSGTREMHLLISGFGGQGIIMAGDIVGKAAVLHDGKFATMTQAYGPEARGGACSAQVIVSGEEILFPCVGESEILITMSQESFAKNAERLQPGGILLWDADLVKPDAVADGIAAYNIPATRFAEELGNKMMANIVMLGFLTAITGLVGEAAMREAVASSVPAATRDVNQRAFARGCEYGRAILKSRAKQERPGE
jgi:2-oxoglutarate ferredoxin oxidoreductase subunit gamma